MDYGSGMHHHDAAALREDEAGERATCAESARAHYVLADLHRRRSVEMSTATQLNDSAADLHLVDPARAEAARSALALGFSDLIVQER